MSSPVKVRVIERREVHLLTKRIYAWRVSVGEKASTVFGEEGILHILPFLGFWHFFSFVPIDFEEAGVDGLCRVASVV